ncbi:(E2-independent) E3 ubiquitin-conjugating enzyme FATS [Falco biarmicus]|uniref:(E2-independent) E3 ubiquitin-conjugating enzyme FATS n=1 Tax=Falco cherrug TaxID=345164 RepID=UPI002478FA33|nr:(E2-independent) E3 ubiquitin-conjugating enzyme FATS [Falco cherrug]XP_056208072.1 (E2-independent) E3 ubiquitin-conjugating enzyme FATS [Falco biarmicus]
MPSAEPPAPRLPRHGCLPLRLTPGAQWTRDTQSFVTQMYLTVSYSSWKQMGRFGVTQKQWGADGQRTCAGLRQKSAAARKSSSAKESLSSHNTTLISPTVISPMIDENKSKENWPTSPMQSVIPLPCAHHRKQSLANHGSVNVNRAFTVLPSRLEIQASLDDTTASLDSPVAECRNQQKGFASITVTARRVAAGARDPAHGPGAVQEPDTTSPTSSKVRAALPSWPPPGHAHQHASLLKISESCSQLGEEPQKQLFDPRNKKSEVGLQSSDGREKAPPSFFSCVHLQVSQQCPNTIYYLDKSLNVCIDQPRIKCPKIHRSTLSFNINCSLSRLTADGVDGIANGEPIEEIFQTKLLGENKTPLRANMSATLKENNVINKDKTSEGYLGSKYPLPSVFVSELSAFVDIPRGPNNVVTAKKDDDKQSGSYHTAFSLQRPSSSDEAGTEMLLGSKKQQCTTGRIITTASGSLPDTASRKAIAAATDGSSKKGDHSKVTSKSKEIQAQSILKPKVSVSNSMCNIKASSRILLEENVHRQNQLLKSDYEFCGSSDKIKECKEEDERERARRVTLSAAHSPDVTREKNNRFTQPETSSQPERTPPATRTLREALEIHKPEFISRSRERLKRLEHMVQQRKAQQQSDAPVRNQGVLVRKLSSTSTSSKKKQYTIPHPLSDNLFKPKERFIPEKEMHMRSKRIYNNLPEVKKKQEEKEKRIIIQSNRLRVEIFKKQLLDQLLQRNTE